MHTWGGPPLTTEGGQSPAGSSHLNQYRELETLDPKLNLPASRQRTHFRREAATRPGSPGPAGGSRE